MAVMQVMKFCWTTLVLVLIDSAALPGVMGQNYNGACIEQICTCRVIYRTDDSNSSSFNIPWCPVWMKWHYESFEQAGCATAGVPGTHFVTCEGTNPSLTSSSSVSPFESTSSYGSAPSSRTENGSYDCEIEEWMVRNGNDGSVWVRYTSIGQVPECADVRPFTPSPTMTPQDAPTETFVNTSGSSLFLTVGVAVFGVVVSLSNL